MYKILAIVLLLFSMNVHQVFAQGASSTASTISLRIDAKNDSLKQFSARDTVNIHFDSLAAWVKQSGHDVSKFTLYIDGIAFTEFKPTLIKRNSALQYYVKRTPATKDAWKTVLSRRLTWDDGLGFYRDVPLTVRNPTVKIDNEVSAKLIVISAKWWKIFVYFFIGTFAVFLWLAVNSDIIRVPGEQQGTDRKPYSLARTQMALWFFTVIVSYVFIWIVTNDLKILEPSVLGLIGISAATGLSAAVVGSNKKEANENKLKELNAELKEAGIEKATLESEIKNLEAQIKAGPANVDDLNTKLAGFQAKHKANETAIAEINKKIKKIKDGHVLKSRNFIKDILNDDNGVSFHRFQIFVWTIVLMFIFATDVYYDLSMPDFDGSLLALMGISSGTYIGFKLPEQQS